MRLVIAEKPSVSQSLAAVLGAGQRREGYLEGNGWLVSWCVGHLAELADAAAYDPACLSCRRAGGLPSPRTSGTSLTYCGPSFGGRT